MKDKLKEERGYTLVIALLLIVLFLSMSAVFIQASLSHAKQEQTVDQGNLAVTAAEMGVEKYTKEAEKAFANTYTLINAEAQKKKALLEVQVKNYPAHAQLNPNCTKAKYTVMQEWINCNIAEYDKELRAQFLSEMKNQLALSNMTEEKVSDTLSHIMSSPSLQPVLAANNIIELDLEVQGKKKEVSQVSAATTPVEKVKSLSTKLKFPEVPFFDTSAVSEVEVKWDQPIKDVTNFFPQLLEKPLGKCPDIKDIKIDMPPCEYTDILSTEYLKALKDAKVGSSFFIKVNGYKDQLNNINAYGVPIFSVDGTITSIPNINQTDYFTLYYKGTLDLKNANKHANKNFIVAEMVTFHTSQDLVENTIIIVGNTARIAYKPDKLTINNGSKLCINLDGITPDPVDLFTTIDTKKSNLDVQGTGKIYLFSKTATPTVNPTLEKVVYFNDATKFLETCGVSINYNVEGKEKFSLPLLISDLKWDLEMDVDYQP